MVGGPVWGECVSGCGGGGKDASAESFAHGGDGCFVFEVPVEPLVSAVVGAELEGAATVDLEPNGRCLDPGDVVVVVDDLLPSHLRYA